MKAWNAYIERDGRKYFVARASQTSIMAMVNRKAAELELPEDIIADIDYEVMEGIPAEWLNVEELI